MTKPTNQPWSTPTLVPAYEMGSGPRSGEGPVWDLARDILRRLDALPEDQALRYQFADMETAQDYGTRVAAVVRKQHGNAYIRTRARKENDQAFLYVRRGINHPKEQAKEPAS